MRIISKISHRTCLSFNLKRQNRHLFSDEAISMTVASYLLHNEIFPQEFTDITHSLYSLGRGKRLGTRWVNN